MPHRGIILGPAILGQAAFDKQQHADSVNAGAIGLGADVLKPFVSNAIPGADTERPPKAVTPGKAAVPMAEPKPVATKKKGVAEPKVVSFSETEVQIMLAKDPNAWDEVLDAESKRPDGVRKLVAQLVLAAADHAAARPVPETVLATLREVVES